jgi:hypothetical protein
MTGPPLCAAMRVMLAQRIIVTIIEQPPGDRSGELDISAIDLTWT